MLINGNFNTSNSDLTNIQAEFCAAVGDPSRVKIVYSLAEGSSNVKSLAESIGLSSSATSRHLKILRDRGLVRASRQGHTVEYSLAAPELITALDIFLDILNNQLAHRASLVQLERYDEEQ
ncbi:MAG: winged helix-turn-helix transcriptional regulator [Anaerolineales bacterium]|nr:winged helix-turn-helix transcriptional regulator [Anaerolineales bacterium]